MSFVPFFEKIEWNLFFIQLLRSERVTIRIDERNTTERPTKPILGNLILKIERLLIDYHVFDPKSRRRFSFNKDDHLNIDVYLTFHNQKIDPLPSVYLLYINHPQFFWAKSKPNLLCSLLIGIEPIYMYIILNGIELQHIN